MASEETKITSASLIAADKVEGTDVYNLEGEKLGTVEDIMRPAKFLKHDPVKRAQESGTVGRREAVSGRFSHKERKNA